MTAELHHRVPLAQLRGGALAVTVTADPAAREAAAERLGIPALASLDCTFRLQPADAGVVIAEGELVARLTQDCVVSLEPFETELRESFRLRFVPAGSESDDIDPEADDEIPYADGVIDLGEAAVEQLALALDPYPRRPDADLPAQQSEETAAPFAALARLKRSS